MRVNLTLVIIIDIRMKINQVIIVIKTEDLQYSMIKIEEKVNLSNSRVLDIKKDIAPKEQEEIKKKYTKCHFKCHRLT